jgi:hypothetical protein
MTILIFAAVTVILGFVAYLAGYSAGKREQVRQTLRRTEDDAAVLSYDEYLAVVLDDLRKK